MSNELVLPNHIGIIMDGNGRWAVKRGLPRTAGHSEGAKIAKRLLLHMSKLGVKYVSLYAFSTENFKREKTEVNFLMNLFVDWFKKDFQEVIDNNAKIVFSGRKEPLPKNVLKTMDEIVEKSKNNTGLVVNVCLNYGSVAEMVDMTKKIANLCKDGKINVDDIDDDMISKNLYNDLPPLDYVIRTSGELRLSNFMMYQASYAEFYFPETLFPDFDEKEFDKAIEEFNKRNRRFGNA